MGGDYGPSVVIPAAIAAIKRRRNLHLLLVGDEAKITAELAAHGAQQNDSLRICHASEVVGMDEQPALALRSKKDSSMRVAINLVKQSEAQACVSAGNTGALMATAHFVLKTLPGVHRPAIIAEMPTMNAEKNVRVLDLGANVDSSAEQLMQFAVMGSVVSHAVDNIERPKVGLLNVGAEQIKGNELVKCTDALLKQHNTINYIGYVEGDDIYKGNVDIVVCDGFVGNIALKTSEGCAKLIAHILREAFTRNWFTKLSALFAIQVLKRVRKRFDPSRYNGASLVGLNGTVIKSHGGANATSFGYAIDEAVSEVTQTVSEQIRGQVATILTENE